MIRYGQVQAHDPEDRREKPFGLPEWLMEEETERQCGFDGEIRVLRLPATRANARGFPGRNGLRRQPQGHVASADQSSIIGPPVGDAVFRFVREMDS